MYFRRCSRFAQIRELGAFNSLSQNPTSKNQPSKNTKNISKKEKTDWDPIKELQVHT